ncbi:MAG: hypothetical protein ACJ8GJ_16105 [Vitreoscilla sp.]
MLDSISADALRACKLIRGWNDALVTGAAPPTAPSALAEAVVGVKRYLEREKADGKPIRQLEIAEQALATPDGLRSVMPFVFSAEAMEAAKRRKAMC